MDKITRRKFMSRSLATAAGVTAGLTWQRSVWSRPLGANDDIRLGIAGIHNQGGGHIKGFSKLPGVRVVALCDPDKQVLAQRAKELDGDNASSPVKGYADVREMLDNKDVDAIVIAAPNHWHALMTILACQAGKHVYVEKPVSHSIWEGRKMVEVARKYQRIVQAGTQHRSCPAVKAAAEDIQAGVYGKVLWAHTSKLKARDPIGLVTQPQRVPEHIDYNLWAGPAPMTPVMRRQFHYDWHWQWNWGDGEMGNWGPHYVDDIRNLLGWKSVPNSVIAAGNRFAWNDNGQTPNMHFALFDYDGTKVVVDIRNLPDPKRPGGENGATYLESRGGNYIQCEAGSIRISRGGGWAYDHQGKRVKQYIGDSGRDHRQNFIDALRSGRRKDLNAEIEIGHLSTAMCHLANIAFRAGNNAPIDQLHQNIKDHQDALNTYKDMLEQLEGNDVNLKKTPFIFGPQLTFNPKTERFTGPHAQTANPFD